MRVQFEYVKAITMAAQALLTFVAISAGGGPAAYDPGVALLPIVFGLLTVYFCWKASVFRHVGDRP